MNTDSKFDEAILRQPTIALDHTALKFQRAANGVDDATELGQKAVAGAFDDAPAMGGDCRIDKARAQGPEPIERTLFIRARQPAETGDVRSQDCRPVSV
jgi:hypothetical protein